MKDKLMAFIKYNRWIYAVYFYVCSLAINILKLFVRTDDRLILFSSFGGKKYDDSPKELYEAICTDERFQKYRCVWAFHRPGDFKDIKLESVKTDTFAYFKTALKARCWVTNSSMERGLRFKGKRTFYFNTWHGTPIKKMGSDISQDNTSFRGKMILPIDIMTVQSDYEAEIFGKSFQIPMDKFLKAGLPRNDCLAHYTEQDRAELRKKFHLPSDKMIVLYAPTFREYQKDSSHRCVMNIPFEISKWEQSLADRYVVLFRAHYEVARVMGIQNSDFIKDVSAYPNLNELMILSDVLISDYSSVFFDYSIMEKPMLYYTYDYDEYTKKRGMYFDIRTFLNGSDTEEDLIGILRNLDIPVEQDRSRSFKKKFVEYYGEATQKSLDCILHHIER